MPSEEKFKKKQLNEEQFTSEDYEYVTVPPDGGFGWVIAFAAMVFWILLNY